MQKEIKRFTLIALAVGLVCILLAGSALAIVSPVRNSGISLLSLNDDDLSRSVQWVGSSYMTLTNSGTQIYQENVNPFGPLSFQSGSWVPRNLSGTTSGKTSSGSTTNVSSRIYVSAGSYVDIVIPFQYSAADYNTFVFSGTVGASPLRLYAEVAGSPTGTAALNADLLQLLINGEVVQSFNVTSIPSGFSTTNVFDFGGYVFTADSDLTSITLRFLFQSDKSAGGSIAPAVSLPATVSGSFDFGFKDNAVVNASYVSSELPYASYFERVISMQNSQSLNLIQIKDVLSSVADNLSSISGTNGIQAIVRILDPSTEGSVGNTISNIGSIYASSEDIQLKEGTKDFASAATDLMIGDSEDGSSGLLGSDSVSNVKDLKKIGNAIKSWFSFDVDIGELFTFVDSGASDWFSSDTATGIDSVGSIQSAAVDDDSDPYNMQDYYDFIDSLFAKYGGGVND